MECVYNMPMKVSQVHTTLKRHPSSFIILTAMLVGALGLLLPVPLLARLGPEDPRKLYFEETGFWVTSEFLDYFDANGGLEIFGYPISSQYNERGILVQYFQKARIELHALNPEPYRVQMGLLGDELGLRRDAVPAPIAPGRVYFTETGHTVTYMFLRYFRAHGGIDVFGYPISEMLNENQKIVQYFQRLKLIWDPNTAQMTVGNLGEIYVNANRGTIPTDVLEPAAYRYGSESVQALRVAVGVSQMMAEPVRGQGVTVVVMDDWLDEPVHDAIIRLTVIDEKGEELQELTQVLRTGPDGRLSTSLALDDVRPGTWLTLHVEAALGKVQQVQSEFFLVW